MSVVDLNRLTAGSDFVSADMAECDCAEIDDPGCGQISVCNCTFCTSCTSCTNCTSYTNCTAYTQCYGTMVP